MSIKKHPYHLLLIVALLLLMCYFFWAPSTTDMHFHDTYFIIDHRTMFGLLAALQFLIWLFYLVSQRLLFANKLTWLHIFISIITSVLIIRGTWPSSFDLPSEPGSPRRLYQREDLQSVITVWAIIGQIAGILIYIVNLLIGLIQKLRRPLLQ